MKRIILILAFLFVVVFSYSQTNSIVTEYYLANHFTPKSGITPGSNNTLAMDCDQINNRYDITISGATISGKRLPSQNQIAQGNPFYQWLITGFSLTSSSYNFTIPGPTTIPAKNILIVSVGSKYIRGGNAPTYDGVSMTVGNSNQYSTIFYLYNVSSGKVLNISNPNSYQCLVNVNIFGYTANNVQFNSSNTNSSATSVSTSTTCNTSYYNLVYGNALFSSTANSSFSITMSDTGLGGVLPSNSSQAIYSNYSIQPAGSSYSMTSSSPQADDNIYYSTVSFYSY